MQTIDFLRLYLRERPLFLSVLRAKEAAFYQPFLPFVAPVLDVGCGDGFFARVTFGKKKVDVGLDMINSRMDEASGVYKQLVVYDGQTFPFRNRMFQTVIINSVLEHVENLPRILFELRRVIVYGGICYATVMAEPWEAHVFGAKLFGNAYRRWMKKKQAHVNLLTHEEWRKAFTKAGFQILTVTPYLSPRAAAWLDVLHYLSLPSLLSYAINRRWVWWPNLTNVYPVRFFARLMDEPVLVDEAGALFFVLKR